jgi:hypothetical protein
MRVSTMRCSLSFRRADWEPGLSVALVVERSVETMRYSFPFIRLVVKK